MFDSIIDPTVGAGTLDRSAPSTLAVRPTSVTGLRLGLLANTKRNAEAFLEETASVLEERYGVRPQFARKKASITDPVPAAMLQEIVEDCDIAITGVGDCGSCSASAVADGLLLERSGVPAVVICSDAFKVSADAMATLHGAEGYRYVTTEHPVASLTREGVRARAERAVPEIVALLTDGSLPS